MPKDFVLSPKFTLAILLLGSIMTFSIWVYVDSIKNQFEEARDLRQVEIESASTNALVVSRLLGEIGYGGAIHSFKNYILRRDERYAIIASERFFWAREKIEELRQRNLGKETEADLVVIDETLLRYLKQLSQARSLVVSGAAINEIDQVVRIDDEPALAALNALVTRFQGRTVAERERTSGAFEDVMANVDYGYILILVFWAAIAFISYLYARQQVIMTDLAAERQKALAADKAKTEFLATMSHEMRTPVAGVIGLSELVLKEQISPQARAYTEKSKSAAQGLVNILNEVLDISRIQANKMEIEKTPFDPREIVESIKDLLEERTYDKGVDLVVEISDSVPALLVNDPQRLRQIWLNLAGNAVKFTPSGSVTLSVDFEHETFAKGRLSFVVTDTGIGIPEDQLGRVFEEFVQVDSSLARPFGGTGLGLSISKRFTDLLGGDISVESTEGAGTTFRVDVPCMIEQRAKVRRADEPVTVTDRLQSMTVLIAEDDDLMLRVSVAKLQPYFADIIVAKNGVQALDAARKGDVDLVLMDIRMPDMDGIEATRCIRALAGKAGQVTIIGLTNDVVASRTQACLDAGMNHVLTKPIDIDDFFKSIDDLITDQALT